MAVKSKLKYDKLSESIQEQIFYDRQMGEVKGCDEMKKSSRPFLHIHRIH